MLFDVILSATGQDESSKPGCASGVSSACLQFVSAGRVTACAPGNVPRRDPLDVAEVFSVLPFQVIAGAAAAHTSTGPASAVSPVRASVPSSVDADRSRCEP